MRRIALLCLVLLVGRYTFGQGQNFPSGSSTTSTITASGILSANLMAEYKMLECSGTTISDSSGNGRTGTFATSTAAPTWVNGGLCTTTAPYGGTQFLSANSQFISLPAALNSARTIYIVTNFNPTPALSNYQSPISGNGAPANNWGIFFANLSAGLVNAAGGYPFSGPGQYMAEGWGAGNAKIGSVQSPAGINLFAYTLGSAGDSTNDQIWVANNIAPFQAVEPALQNNAGFGSTGQSSGLVSSGNFQLGGSASGQLLASFPTFYNGQMYYVAMYSTYHTGAQIAFNMQAIAAQMAQRGIQLNQLNAFSGVFAQAVLTGDSITWGTGLTTNYAQYMALNAGGSWNWVDIGLPSITAQQQATEAEAQIPDGFFWGGGSQVEVLWAGTNDCAGGSTGPQAEAYLNFAARQHKKHFTGPSRLIVASMISRTGQDTCKNALNGPLRQTWATFADGFVDIAEDANLGADGASANATYFQGDAIHPTTHGQANDIAPMVQRAINRMYGNTDWSSATTYTTAALGTTATTAGSETGNTITLTFAATPANCQVGNQMVVTGATPAGYNSSGDGWQILTRTSTTVTFWSNTTGLGAITVQGAGICPQQQDVDTFTILGGSATSPSFLLEPCTGYTGQSIQIKNANITSAWVITPWLSSQTIDGATTLTMPTATSGNFPVVILQSQLVSASAGGCTWKRLQ